MDLKSVQDRLKRFLPLVLILISFGVVCLFVLFFLLKDVLSPSQYYFGPHSLANYSIGMSEGLCRGANGAPDAVYSTVGSIVDIELRGYGPSSDRVVDKTAYFYDQTTYCLVVYFNEDGECCYIHIGYT